MKKLLGILFVLFLLVLTASPQAVLRGRLTTNEAAWQESPLLPGLTATNLTVASNLTVRGSALNPLLPGTNVTFTTNAGVVSIHVQSGGLKATNANQFGTGEVLTVKSGALFTNLTVYGDGTNALVLSSGVLTSSLPAIDISQTWSNSGAVFTGIRFNAVNSNSSSSSLLLDLQTGSSSKMTVNRDGTVFAGANSSVAGWLIGGPTRQLRYVKSSGPSFGLALSGDSTGVDGPDQITFGAPGLLVWRNNNYTHLGAEDLFVGRDSAASLQVGSDSATATAQTLKSHDGSGTDKSGADFRLAAGQGTGTGAGGTLNLATAAAGSASTNTANSYSNRVSISPNGAVTINPTTTNAPLLTLNSGVLTSSAPAIDISQTWSNSGVLFTGLRLNATDIASGSTSVPFDLQVNGSTIFRVLKNANVSISNVDRIRWGFGGGYNTFLNASGVDSFQYTSTDFRIGSRLSLGLGADLLLNRDAAAVLQLGEDAATTTTAQTLKAHDGSGTDKNGADLRLAAGQGTGVAAGGTLSLATASAGASSTNTLNSYSNRLTIDANGTVTINPTSTNASELVINSGVITNSAPAIDISQTWSNSATTFTGLKLNVTDSNSSATSSLLDVQLGGSNRFRIDKWGSAIFLNTNGIRSDGPNYAHLKLGNGFNVGSGFMFSGYNAPHSPFLNMYMEGSGEWTARLMAGASFSWTDNPSLATSGTRDLILQRDSAATLQLGNDAATALAQTLKAHDGSGTDKNGADLTVAAGRGTGTGVGGSFAIATSAQGNVSTNTLNTASNRLVINPNGAVTLNPTTTNATLLTLNSGVITSSAPALSISQTWSNSGVTFAGLRLNVTDSNSASGSLLADLQVGGSSRFSIDKSGKINVPTTSDLTHVFCADANTASLRAGAFQFLNGSTVKTVIGQGKFIVESTTPITWGSSGVSSTDLNLVRDAAATLQLGGDAATVTDQTLKAHDGSGTDKDGATLAIAGGQGTGAAKGGSVVFRTAPAGGSGSSKNSYGDRNFVYSGRTTLGVNSAYDLFEVNLPDGEMVGLEVFVTTFSVGSGSDRIVNTDNFNVSAYSYGTAAYSSVSSNNISTTKSSGFDTVTTSFDVLDLNQNAFRVRVTPTFGTSTSGVTVTAVWQVRVNSTVPTTVTPF